MVDVRLMGGTEAEQEWVCDLITRALAAYRNEAAVSEPRRLPNRRDHGAPAYRIVLSIVPIGAVPQPPTTIRVEREEPEPSRRGDRRGRDALGTRRALPPGR